MPDDIQTQQPVAHRPSLEELDGQRWGDPPAGASRLVATVHTLRRKPVDLLSVEDLRLLLGQQVGMAELVPLALEHVEHDPLAEGDYYPGDLLAALLRLPGAYWTAHPDHRDRLDAVAAKALTPSEDPDRQPGVDLGPLVETLRSQR
jgi:hypothetical protein